MDASENLNLFSDVICAGNEKSEMKVAAAWLQIVFTKEVFMFS